MLYPLSYRGNGNYCTTKWDLGRSLVCRLVPFPSWRSWLPYPSLPYDHGLQLLNGRADCAFLGRGESGRR